MKNSSSTEILNTIKKSQNILVNMDTRTDFDALCSSVVMSNFLTSLNKSHKVIHTNKIKDTFMGYFDFEIVQRETDLDTIDLKTFDLIIFLDSGKSTHVSKNELFKIPNSINTINIDHHKTNDYFASLNYVYQLGSNCTVLYKFFKEISWELDLINLEILSVGIITDTGFFKNDNLTADDFLALSEIMSKGIPVWTLVTKLSNYEPYDQIKYKELVYNNIVVNFEKKYAYAIVRKIDVENKNIDMNKVYVRHSDLLKYIQEIEFAFVVSDINAQPGTFDISFRTTSAAKDMAQFAELFGGGGHRGAAGGIIEGARTFDEAVQLVLNKLNLI